MERDKHYFEKYMLAKKRVDNQKNFYAHIVVYLVMNVLLFFFKGKIINFFLDRGVSDQGFLNWMEWNIILIPVLWGIVLLVIGIYLFKLKPFIFKNWKEKQIQKYMEE